MLELGIVIAVLVLSLITLIIVIRGNKVKSLINVVVIISVLIAAGALALSFFESDESKIIRRVDTFTQAMNNGDLNAAIDCFDPLSRNTIKAVAGIGNAILGGLTGFSFDIIEIFGLVIGYGAMSGNLDIGFELTVVNIEFINDTRANAYVIVKTSYDEDIFPIPMMKDGMDWFIDVSSAVR